MGHTSNEAKKRYNDKAYNSYLIRLRKVEDAELIARIEELKASGLQTTAAIKKLIKREAIHEMKTIIKLTQDAYPAGPIDSPWFEACAIDDEGRVYMVRWDVRDDFRLDDDDAGNACDWDNPSSIRDDHMDDVTDRVILAR